MKLLKMFASTAHITYNKYIANKFGVDEAILFGELCSKYEQFTDGEIGTNDDEFYCTMENLIEDTCLTEYRIRHAIKNLVAGDLLSVHKKGIPAKNWYKLNENRILDLCDIDVQRTSPAKFNSTGDVKIARTGDSNFYSTIYNKKENKKEIIKNNKGSRKSRIFKDLEKKFLEYDIQEDIAVLIEEFYNVLIENKKMISVQKMDADLGNLAKVSVSKQKQTIETALSRGWQSLNPEWLNTSKSTSYNTSSNNHLTDNDEIDKSLQSKQKLERRY